LEEEEREQNDEWEERVLRYWPSLEKQASTLTTASLLPMADWATPMYANVSTLSPPGGGHMY
jgi:hypothetical protein